MGDGYRSGSGRRLVVRGSSSLLLGLTRAKLKHSTRSTLGDAPTCAGTHTNRSLVPFQLPSKLPLRPWGINSAHPACTLQKSRHRRLRQDTGLQCLRRQVFRSVELGRSRESAKLPAEVSKIMTRFVPFDHACGPDGPACALTTSRYALPAHAPAARSAMWCVPARTMGRWPADVRL
jgi:hypothetical protein